MTKIDLENHVNYYMRSDDTLNKSSGENVKWYVFGHHIHINDIGAEY